MAITYQNSAQFNATSGTSYGGAFDAGAGANRILLVFTFAECSPAQTVSSITYNGVGLTKFIATTTPSGAIRIDAWYLVAPATGSNTLTNNMTGTINSNGCTMAAVVYNGVIQSASGINKSAVAHSSGGDVTTISASVTPDVANCWVTGYGQDQDRPSDLQAPYTPRLIVSTWDVIGDSNGSVAQSLQTMTWTIDSARKMLAMVAALAPVITGPVNLGSMNGVAKASMASVNGVAIANISNINGVA